jgi:hypothetical protein
VNESIPILFADDTSIFITNHSPIDYENNFTQILQNINVLSLNFDKTYFTQFSTKNNIINMPINLVTAKLLHPLILNSLD